MKLTKNLLVLSAVAVLTTGCIRASNTIVSEKGATMPSSYKQGRSCSFLGLGDNSIASAAREVGIKTVVSSTTANYFGAVVCTYVQGN